MKLKKIEFKTLISIFIAIILYFGAIGYNMFTNNSTSTDSSVKKITIAHWQLEDGVREGFDVAIKKFEALKLKQGIKVKVIQNAIPTRGYKQWYLTQLVSGHPVDLIQLLGSPHIQYQYMTHLSPYIGAPNPFNKGTPLEGLPWKDTLLDGMNSTLDKTYQEYFGVKTSVHYVRLFANLDLLEKATGNRKMPNSIAEWIEMSKKLKQYGLKKEQTLIPIVGPGTDRMMLWDFLARYFSQLNGTLADKFGRYYDADIKPADILKAYIDGQIPKEQFLGVADIVKDLGENFAEGFNVYDYEQALYLFYTGKAGFFIGGTYNLSSVKNNTKFDLGIGRLPVVDGGYKLSKYYTGDVLEIDTIKGGKFGIPKDSKNFDLALEFLQFITSYDINQLLANYSKFPPVVKYAKYEGILKFAKPVTEGNPPVQPPPFFSGVWRSASMSKMMESLENIVLKKVDNPEDYFYNQFKSRKSVILRELKEQDKSLDRGALKYESQRSQIFIGLLRKDLTKQERNSLRSRRNMLVETFEKSTTRYFYIKDFKKYMNKL